MADAGSNPLGSGNPMNAGSQGGFQVNEGAASANIRGAMPRGGGGGGIAGAIKDIAGIFADRANRERDNIDFAWREGVKHENNVNLSKLQHGHVLEQIGTQGEQERKTVKTAGKQTRKTAAQAGSIQAGLITHQTNASEYSASQEAKRAKKTRKQEAGITEAQAAATHRRTLAQGRAEVRNVGKVAELFEPGKVASVAAGGATGNGMLRKAAPTAAAAQKATAKPRTTRKPPTAK